MKRPFNKNLSGLTILSFLLFSIPGIVAGQSDSVTSLTVADSSFIDIERAIELSMNYLKDHDFDGDGKPDNLGFGYTGGAHCCYLPSLFLTSTGKNIDFPFEMDGGYTFGMPDGTNPEYFRIEDIDEDGLPEILIFIATYNGVPYKIPAKWRRGWKFKTNRIIIEVENGKVQVTDQEMPVK